MPVEAPEPAAVEPEPAQEVTQAAAAEEQPAEPPAQVGPQLHCFVAKNAFLFEALCPAVVIMTVLNHRHAGLIYAWKKL